MESNRKRVSARRPAMSLVPVADTKAKRLIGWSKSLARILLLYLVAVWFAAAVSTVLLGHTFPGEASVLNTLVWYPLAFALFGLPMMIAAWALRMSWLDIDAGRIKEIAWEDNRLHVVVDGRRIPVPIRHSREAFALPVNRLVCLKQNALGWRRLESSDKWGNSLEVQL